MAENILENRAPNSLQNQFGWNLVAVEIKYISHTKQIACWTAALGRSERFIHRFTADQRLTGRDNMKAVIAVLLLLCYLHASCDAARRPWKCSESARLYGATQVDAGMGKVVASNRYNYGYFLSGSSWYILGRTRLKHVTVGHSGIWGSCKANKVYKYVGGDFKLARGLTMYQVDAGGHQVVGVRARTYYAYCLKKKTALDYCGRGNLRWTYLRRTMRYYSCGPMFGCWGVDTSYRVWVTKSMSPTNCRTSGWTRVRAPKMKMIEVSTDGKVFGLTTTGMIVQRMGINYRRRQGTGWGSVPMCMPVKHLSYDLCNLWVVTTSGMVLKCSH